MPSTNNQIEKRLWDAADELRASFRARGENLRCTCNLLLPRLISGQLDVSDLPIDLSMPDLNRGEPEP